MLSRIRSLLAPPERKASRTARLIAFESGGRARHVGAFPALEDEMADFGLDGLTSGRSPDRLDALVWAVTALSYGARAEPRVRGL